MKRFFDTEIESLRSDLLHMGEKVISQLRLALKAYAEHDPAIADEVIAADNDIDDFEMRIDEESIRYMGLRSPIATELRILVTGMKASHDLERAGDEITKIARRIRHLSGQAPLKTAIDIARMGEIAIEMLRDALHCMVEGSEEKAMMVVRRDVEVDWMNRQVCDELTQEMMENRDTISRAIDLIFISKALERVADHASNIAEETIFLFKAKDVRHDPENKQAQPGASAD
jgi:phosphate transport system protein